jgi:hypothetical protein
MFAGDALILLLFILFFVFGARPTVHAIKAFQARHARKAFALMEKQKWQRARVEAVVAYQLYPAEPQALRAAARFLSRTHHSDALEFWRQLAEKQRSRAKICATRPASQ